MSKEIKKGTNYSREKQTFLWWLCGNWVGMGIGWEWELGGNWVGIGWEWELGGNWLAVRELGGNGNWVGIGREWELVGCEGIGWEWE